MAFLAQKMLWVFLSQILATRRVPHPLCNPKEKKNTYKALGHCLKPFFRTEILPRWDESLHLFFGPEALGHFINK